MLLDVLFTKHVHVHRQQSNTLLHVVVRMQMETLYHEWDSMQL